ncbi:IS200/IS605 family transposase [Deinococcus sp.]|uniref:IS200/IS605 family transposase n=1 Tax=Deinococcus sp. TaxID=47478 RepID=UPI0025C3298D|nr:IS200/IS605 family transposase [Deinococcus sp.]
MRSQRSGNHTVSRLTVHVVWSTKYRHPVLVGDIKPRCRELLIQMCKAQDVKILKGVISSDHVHMRVGYPPKLAVSDLVKRMKGRTSRLLQDEYPKLKKQFWGQHFWGGEYGAWSTGHITEEMVQEYLEHHRNLDDSDDSAFILEE